MELHIISVQYLEKWPDILLTDTQTKRSTFHADVLNAVGLHLRGTVGVTF